MYQDVGHFALGRIREDGNGDPSEGDLEYYRPALAYMFDSMKRLYPKAKLYFMIDMGLCDYDPVARTFVEDALKIANHYNIDCIKLYDI